jgi:hypothetical protein
MDAVSDDVGREPGMRTWVHWPGHATAIRDNPGCTGRTGLADGWPAARMVHVGPERNLHPKKGA